MRENARCLWSSRGYNRRVRSVGFVSMYYSPKMLLEPTLRSTRRKREVSSVPTKTDRGGQPSQYLPRMSSVDNSDTHHRYGCNPIRPWTIKEPPNPVTPPLKVVSLRLLTPLVPWSTDPLKLLFLQFADAVLLLLDTTDGGVYPSF